MSKVMLVLCTFPDVDQARQIGTLMIERQLAACVNLLPGVESIYRWEGNVETAREALAIFKTTAGGFPQFRDALASAHPYDVPEIVAFEPAHISPAYRDWVIENVPPPLP